MLSTHCHSPSTHCHSPSTHCHSPSTHCHSERSEEPAVLSQTKMTALPLLLRLFSLPFQHSRPTPAPTPHRHPKPGRATSMTAQHAGLLLAGVLGTLPRSDSESPGDDTEGRSFSCAVRFPHRFVITSPPRRARDLLSLPFARSLRCQRSLRPTTPQARQGDQHDSPARRPSFGRSAG